MPRLAVTALLFAAFLLVPAVAQAAPCDGVGSQKPFLDWHDHASYVLVSGGDFESAAADWTLSDGAAVVAGGNELRPDSSANSLSLPGGASATTPPICVGKGDPVARIFMRSSAATGGGPTGLQVKVLYLNAQGEVRKAKKAGTLRGTDEWAPSRRFSLAQGQFSHGAKPPTTTPPTTDPYQETPPAVTPPQDTPPKPPHGHGGDHHQGGGHRGGSGSIELRFTAGTGSGWQIDDVFVDPRARH